MKKSHELIAAVPLALITGLGITACGDHQPAVVCSTDHLVQHTVEPGDTFWSYARQMDPGHKEFARGDLAEALKDVSGAGSYNIEAGQSIMLVSSLDACHAS